MQADLKLDHKDHPVFSKLPAIFRDCVTDSSIRFCLEFPQLVGEYVYATDGRILVRSPAIPEVVELIPDIAPKKFPAKSCTQLIGSRDDWDATPVSLPSLDHLERCTVCKGAGHRPTRPCSCEMYDEDETPCRGLGTIPAGQCWDCEGTGIERPRVVSITLRPDVDLSVFYIRLLARHEARVYLPSEANTPSSIRPVYFTVEGVEGVVMPMELNSEEWKARGLARPRRSAKPPVESPS